MSIVSYLPPESVRSVAAIGMGSVGAGWTALFLARGLKVIAFDPSEDAEGRARAFVEEFWPSLVKLGVTSSAKPAFENLCFVGSAAAAASAADLIQENVPEKPAIKADVLREIDAAATPEKIILSSTGGIPPSQLQQACVHPERLVVLHPFNPSHLVSLVEVVGGQKTSPAVVQWAMDFATFIGKVPIELHAEATGHMTNRLQFALVREAVRCLVEGVASAEDIDKAVRYGLGPRWTLMGSLLTLHLAGGPGGMGGILNHAGKAIEEWWTPSTETHLTPDVIAKLVAASREVSDQRPINEWVAWRDEQLVDVIKLQAAGESLSPKNVVEEQA